jgi:hypothetical protein
VLLRSAFPDHRYRFSAIVLIVILVRIYRYLIARLEVANLRLSAGLADVFRRTRRLNGANHVIVRFDDDIAAVKAAERSDKCSLVVLIVPAVRVVWIIGIIGVLSASLAREPDTRSYHDLAKARDAGQKENGQC